MTKKKLETIYPILCALLFMVTGSITTQAQTSSPAPGRIEKKSPTLVTDNDPVRPRVIAENRKSEKKLLENGPPPTIRTSASAERLVFDLTNKQRRENGVTELKWNGKVADMARSHSDNMAIFDFFSHTGIHGELVDTRATDNGIDKWISIGENIAFLRGFEDPAVTAVERWMLSPSHRRNLLDPRWRESGIGLAIKADGTYYFTQVFIVD